MCLSCVASASVNDGNHGMQSPLTRFSDAGRLRSEHLYCDKDARHVNAEIESCRIS